jgi:molybdopterin-guanine dinucleotide biosynthesis protein A
VELTGFILAGGRSTRMGRDKALLDWNGRSLLDHMMNLAGTVANPVHVVGRPPLPDRMPGLGPLSGIAMGLEVTFTDANLFLAVDLPLLTKDFLIYLRVRLQDSSHPIIACKIESGFPLCLGIWRPMLPEIQRCLEARQLSVHGLIESSSTEIISEADLKHEGFDSAIFKNLNTPADYQSFGF